MAGTAAQIAIALVASIPTVTIALIGGLVGMKRRIDGTITAVNDTFTRKTEELKARLDTQDRAFTILLESVVPTHGPSLRTLVDELEKRVNRQDTAHQVLIAQITAHFLAGEERQRRIMELEQRVSLYHPGRTG